jgi:hypothetical protein
VVERPSVNATRSFLIPEPEAGAVILKMRYSGICGTDNHTFLGEGKHYASTPHEREIVYPLIFGHDMSVSSWPQAGKFETSRAGFYTLKTGFCPGPASLLPQ